MKLERYLKNPILSPNPDNEWENFAVFNPTIVKEDGVYHMFYRAMGSEQKINGKKLRLSTIGYAKSTDGFIFTDRKQFLAPLQDWERYGLEDPRITKIDDKYYLFYTAVSNYPPNHLGVKCAVAVLDSNFAEIERHLVTPFNAKAMTLFPEKIHDHYTVILSVNTDKPPSHVVYAQFKDIEMLWDVQFWEKWYEHYPKNIINLCRINSDQIEVGATPIMSPHGWVLIYSYIKNYFSPTPIFRIEAALLDKHNPQKIIGRIEEPLLAPEKTHEKVGQIREVVFPEGALYDNENIRVYYGAADNYICTASISEKDFFSQFEINAPAVMKCQKFAHNPLLTPIKNNLWESKAVFNPASVEINGKVYIIYRTLSDKDISAMGLAISHDGLYIDERLPEPIYVPRTRDETMGCEDPRVTMIEDIIYMCYTAYDGKIPKIALTSITKQNFLDRKWKSWAKPIIITEPDKANKDGALFPEKIAGKYVFFHRLEPDMYVDFVDDLEFKTKKYLDCKGQIAPGQKLWDGLKIGINNPPIKTDYGWLVFYHGVSTVDHHYRLGAMMLDLDDPTKLIARTAYPILEPEYYFEIEGIVNNVVFPCGHIIKNGEIYLYYGGADKVVCGAKINLLALVDYLMRTKEKKYIQALS